MVVSLVFSNSAVENIIASGGFFRGGGGHGKFYQELQGIYKLVG